MKKIKFGSVLFMFLTVLIFAGCKDDTEEQVSPYVGSYLISNAKLTSALTITTNEIGPLSIPAGTDITELIQQSLLSAMDCTPENSLIELKNDYSIVMKCNGTNTSLDAGTWEEISSTVLQLNMNSTAIPTSPSGFVLTVNNVKLENKKLSGVTSVPIPKATIALMVSAMSGGLATLNDAATPDVMMIDFSIEFIQQ